MHGILVGGLISTVAGTKLPGPGSIYMSQTLSFVKPAYMDEKLIAEVTLKAVKRNKVFIFSTVVKNMTTGEVLIAGEAEVYNREVQFVE